MTRAISLGAKAFPCHYVTTGLAYAQEDGRSCTCKPLRLTPAQKRVLSKIEPGCYIGDVKQETLAKLEQLGLIEFYEDPPPHAKGGPQIHMIGFRRTRIGDYAAGLHKSVAPKDDAT